MIPIKIQCGCRQKYAFDVEPVGGRIAIGPANRARNCVGTAAANVAKEEVELVEDGSDHRRGLRRRKNC